VDNKEVIHEKMEGCFETIRNITSHVDDVSEEDPNERETRLLINNGYHGINKMKEIEAKFI
jgi:hypothetical protein